MAGAADNPLVVPLLRGLAIQSANEAGPYMIGRATIRTSDVGFIDENVPLFSVAEFLPEDGNTPGYTIVHSRNAAHTCRLKWAELRPLRAINVGPDELVVAIFFVDGLRFKKYSRAELVRK